MPGHSRNDLSTPLRHCGGYHVVDTRRGLGAGNLGMSRVATLVTAGILVKDGQVLLSGRRPGDRLAGFWELPGGKIEVGESPEACLARELAEECGIEAQGGRHRSCAGSNFHLTTRATLSWPSWWGATHVWLWLANSTR